jgi:hypothetical protein
VAGLAGTGAVAGIVAVGPTRADLTHDAVRMRHQRKRFHLPDVQL